MLHVSAQKSNRFRHGYCNTTFGTRLSASRRCTWVCCAMLPTTLHSRVFQNIIAVRKKKKKKKDTEARKVVSHVLPLRAVFRTRSTLVVFFFVGKRCQFYFQVTTSNGRQTRPQVGNVGGYAYRGFRSHLSSIAVARRFPNENCLQNASTALNVWVGSIHWFSRNAWERLTIFFSGIVSDTHVGTFAKTD